MESLQPLRMPSFSAHVPWVCYSEYGTGCQYDYN